MLQNGNGRADFVLGLDGITGTLNVDSLLYQFEPIGKGFQAIIRVDQSKFPPDHPPHFLSGALIDTASSASIMRKYPPKNIKKEIKFHPPFTDVIVAYTSSVANSVYNIQGFIQNAINRTDTSYVNSNIYDHLRLVKTVEVNYDENGHTYEDYVDALEDPFDGTMDNVTLLRRQNLADIVVLLVNNDDYCGLADAIKATRLTAFAAVDYECAMGYFSFAHEIGHLQGARHDLESDPSLEPFRYGHGYIGPNDNWRTIMAEPSYCNYCTRLQYWSNPYITYNGDPMGNSYAWNAEVIMMTAEEVQDFMALPAPVNLHLINANSFGDSPKFRWTPNPNATSSEVYRCISEDVWPSSTCFEPILNTDGAGINDWNVVMQNPANGCSKRAFYYVTDFNLTGESVRSLIKSVCIAN